MICSLRSQEVAVEAGADFGFDQVPMVEDERVSALDACTL